MFWSVQLGKGRSQISRSQGPFTDPKKALANWSCFRVTGSKLNSGQPKSNWWKILIQSIKFQTCSCLRSPATKYNGYILVQYSKCFVGSKTSFFGSFLFFFSLVFCTILHFLYYFFISLLTSFVILWVWFIFCSLLILCIWFVIVWRIAFFSFNVLVLFVLNNGMC